MAPDLQPAIWNGPVGLGEMPDGRTLVPGDEYLVSERDLQSDHWTPKPTAPQSQPEPSRPATVTFAPPDRADRSDD